MPPNKSTKRPRSQTEHGNLNLNDQGMPTEHGGSTVEELAVLSKRKNL